MCMCNKCMQMGGLMLLVFGIIFLLKDLGVWTFWGINWFTVAFIIVGFWHMASGNCKDCQSCSCGVKETKPNPKKK